MLKIRVTSRRRRNKIEQKTKTLRAKTLAARAKSRLSAWSPRRCRPTTKNNTNTQCDRKPRPIPFCFYYRHRRRARARFATCARRQTGCGVASVPSCICATDGRRKVFFTRSCSDGQKIPAIWSSGKTSFVQSPGLKPGPERQTNIRTERPRSGTSRKRVPFAVENE